MFFRSVRVLLLLCIAFIFPHLALGQAAGFSTCIGNIGSCDSTATSINFGPATAAGGALVPLKITNTGTASLNINYSFSSAAFAFGGSQTLPPNPLVIAPGDSVQTFILFSPTATGVQSGQFVSQDNAPGSPHIISLSGSGVTVPANDFSVMLDPTAPSMVNLKQGAVTTFPVYVLEGTGQNLSAAGSVQCTGGPAGSTCAAAPNFFAAFVPQEKPQYFCVSVRSVDRC